jgi:cysteine-rich repeat protein
MARRYASPVVALTVLAAVAAVPPRPAAGAAGSAADVCPPAADPCVVDSVMTVSPGSCPDAPTVLDFGARRLIIGTATRTGRLDVGSGCMLIRAGALTITAGRGSLRARGDTALKVPAGAVTVIVAGDAILDGPIDANSPYVRAVFPARAGGDIIVQAGGSISVGPGVGVTAASTTSFGPGGSVELSAGHDLDAATGATISAAGGGNGDGGFATLTAMRGALRLANGTTVSAAGGIGSFGGSISLGAVADSTIGAQVDASGGAAGGEVFIDVTGHLTVSRQVLAAGTDLDAEGGTIEASSTGGTFTVDSAVPIGFDASGDASGGGTVTLEAGEAVRLLRGNVRASSANTGEAGEIHVVAGTDLEVRAALQATSGGEDSTGGILCLVAIDGSATIDGAMNVRGRVGGTIDLVAGASIAIGAVTIDCSGGGEYGDGGAVTFSAGRDMAVATGARFLANASSTADAGSGGSIDLSGCAVTVATTARLESVGSPGGVIALTASEQLRAAGTLRTLTGRVLLTYRSDGPVPIVTGASTPPPSLVPAELPTCHACGNRFLDPGELCDDGNRSGCDGCSPSCVPEACGNGIVDCGETCDDGNTADGDCCTAACQLVPPGTPCAPDGNACTADVCSAGECRRVPTTDACEDGNPCTVGDRCDGGRCTAGVSRACDDGNPCTDDGCSPASGCVHLANTASCDDADACTVGDRCGGGQCRGGGVRACDDGNPCTADACDALRGCEHAPLSDGVPCADADPCDGTETCQVGACSPAAPLDCDDGDTCTTDRCDPGRGCVHTIVSGCRACEAAGACDDGDPCTEEACTDSRCVYRAAAEGTSCTDGDACNGSETCVGGACQAGTVLACDDGNPCTDDGCDPVRGCVSVPNTAPCDDGDACTLGDVCAAGTCAAGAPLVCDDGDPCTIDGCDPGTGCRRVPVDFEAVLAGFTQGLRVGACEGEKVPAVFGRLFDRARRILERAAGATKDRTVQRLVKKSVHSLDKAATKAERSAPRRVSDGCASALTRVLGGARQEAGCLADGS